VDEMFLNLHKAESDPLQLLM